MKFLPVADSETIASTLRGYSNSVIADLVGAGEAGELLTNLCQAVYLQALADIGAQEGTVWIVDPEQNVLVPVFNSGPDAATFIHQVRQPLDQGIISMVFCTQESFCESDIQKHQLHDSATDELMQRQTLAMMAVPLCFGGTSRGVCSAVLFEEPGRDEQPHKFGINSLTVLELASEVIGRLIDHRLVNLAVGWELA